MKELTVIDQRQFRVEFTRGPWDPPIESWSIWLEGIAIPTDEVREELIKLAWPESRSFPHHYRLRNEESIINWGTSGSGGISVISVSYDMAIGLGAAGVAAAVSYTFNRLRRRAAGEIRCISDIASASEIVANEVSSVFRIDREEVTILSVRHDATTSTYQVVLNDATGQQYVGEVGLAGVAQSVVRVAIDGGNSADSGDANDPS